MYQIYAISKKDGTQNIGESAETEELAKKKIEGLRMILHAGVFNNQTDLAKIDDFGYDTLE